MPSRIHPIINGEIYHIFNRSVGNQPIFLNYHYYNRAMEVLNYYRYSNPPLRFSFFNRLKENEKLNILTELSKNHNKLIELYSYCLIPNHFHLLTKQIKESGLSTFLRNFQNSYAKFFNTKNNRHGSLFQLMFKAVRIETEEQLLHVARYIHLNPYVACLVKDLKDLENYQWSSLPIYTKNQPSNFIEKDFLLNYYSSLEDFKHFTYNQADFRKKLKNLDYFSLEENNFVNIP